MSSDNNAGKENDKAGDSRQEKRSLQTPDVHEARTADRATIHDIEKQNKDSWQSEHGVFAIVDKIVSLNMRNGKLKERVSSAISRR